MSRVKILLVDDHRVVIEGVKSGLRDHPEFEVVGKAFDGLGAVKQVEELRPDIVIMDISLPGVNGIDATRQIKRFAPETQVIIFTMYSDREYVVDLFKAGISAYVLKEDSLSDLILAINAVKAGGTYFSTMASTAVLGHLKELDHGGREEHVLDSLSPRECEVFALLADGKSVKEIAEQLCISSKTVESHKYNLMAKLDARCISDLTKLAIRKEMIPA